MAAEDNPADDRYELDMACDEVKRLQAENATLQAIVDACCLRVAACEQFTAAESDVDRMTARRRLSAADKHRDKLVTAYRKAKGK